MSDGADGKAALKGTLDTNAPVTEHDDSVWGAAVIVGTRVPGDTLGDDLEERFPTVRRRAATRPGRDGRSVIDLAGESREDSYGRCRLDSAGSKLWVAPG